MDYGIGKPDVYLQRIMKDLAHVQITLLSAANAGPIIHFRDCYAFQERRISFYDVLNLHE